MSVIAAIPVFHPYDLAVNPSTNTIYVTNLGNTVSVIDGATALTAS